MFGISKISSLLESSLENSKFILSQAQTLSDESSNDVSASQESLEAQERVVKVLEDQSKIFEQLQQSVKAMGISSPILTSVSSIMHTCRSMSAKTAKEISEDVKKEKSALKIKLIISDQKGIPLSEITDQDVEDYYLALQEELIRDWKPERPRRAKKPARGKGKGKATGKKHAKQRVVGREPQSQKSGSEKPLPSGSIPSSSSSAKRTKEEQIGEFINSLLVIHSPLKEIPRVTKRWEAATNADIRDFIDNNDGKLVKRYERLSEEEINKQRARHLLPGIDRLLMNKSFQKIYTFPTSRGCGMFATLNYGPFSERGIVYVGISGVTIFHKYFEPFSSAISSGNLTIDPTNAEQADEPGEEWVHTLPFEPSVDGEGQITLRFHKELHYLTIEPVRTDLLNSKLFKCN